MCYPEKHFEIERELFLLHSSLGAFNFFKNPGSVSVLKSNGLEAFEPR
jgi:hypothetical protein